MTPVDEFAAKCNFERFADLIYTEESADRRRILQKLLLEQEDRFGVTTWHLETLETRISKNTDRINKQETLIGWIESQGQGSEYAKKLLDTFRSIQETLLATRARLVAMMDMGTSLP